MSRLLVHCRLLAVPLVALATACGHPPLTAYATPQPIMLGPVQRPKPAPSPSAKVPTAGEEGGVAAV